MKSAKFHLLNVQKTFPPSLRVRE